MKIRNFVVLGLLVLLTACKSDTKEVIASDTTGPELSSSIPAHESDNVDVGTALTLYFNEMVSPSTPNNAIQLREMGSNELVPAVVEAKGGTLVVAPISKLAYEQDYYIESDYDIEDAKGNTIAEPIYIEFSTQSRPIVTVDSIEQGATVAGLVNITGTANDQDSLVQIKVGDAEFVEATGNEEWAFPLDTTLYQDGPINLVIRVTNAYWDTSELSLEVNIQNNDASPTVEIESVSSGDILSGEVTVSGSANESVEQVLVKIGDSYFLEATGTEQWSLTIDTSAYDDGETLIVAKAISSRWEVQEHTVEVSISNVEATPELVVSSITEGETLSGLVSVSGTTDASVRQVLVKIGDADFSQATGTENWSLTVDTTQLEDGSHNIVVRAVNENWAISEQTLSVTTSNIDPMVGTWLCEQQNTYSQHVHDRRMIIFYASGTIKDSYDLIRANNAFSWGREGELIYYVTDSGNQFPSFTFTDDDNFTVSYGISDFIGDYYTTYCSRQ